ncbi:MAG TPA: hypothetical protein VF173_30295 [Thermoanaerobaculia bacterium]|nr:hypothetical protein [Thermoanaerobaculia bacterium]
MRTFEIKATVAPGGELRVMTCVPEDILPGDYRATLILEESAGSTPSGSASKAPLRLKVFDWPGWPANSTFRREEIYDDNGR